jgi:molybdopterin molybdotransferase
MSAALTSAPAPVRSPTGGGLTSGEDPQGDRKSRAGATFQDDARLAGDGQEEGRGACGCASTALSLSFDDALVAVSRLARPTGVERVRLKHAHGRRLAIPVIAPQDAPCVTLAAMDGYAVRDRDLTTLPAQLRIIGRSYPGAGFFGVLEPGACVRVFTGAPTPEGADRVVVQEAVGGDDANAIFAAAPTAARHLRHAGSDFEAGEILLQRGARLTPQALIAAAAANVAHVEVHARPRLALIATGDELFEPGEAVSGVNAIPESVSFGIRALAEHWGARLVSRRRVRDNPPVMSKAAAAALAVADVVVVIGGASLGERDFAKAMFAPLGLDLVVPRVAMKPGKPVWVGRAQDKPVIGLPGNPAAAVITARLFLAPLLVQMAGGETGAALSWKTARSVGAIAACGERETFLRGRATREGVAWIQNTQSSAQKSLVEADHLIRLRPNAPPVAPGDLIEVLDM